MPTKTTSFPSFPPGQGYGTTHSELGRTWEYVEPGIWRSRDGVDGWDNITDKPGQYPPEDHLHVIADVQGLQVELDSKALKTDLDTEVQARIDGDADLQGQIDSLEAYNDSQIQADLATETQARIDGDANLQDQIDNIDVAMDEPASDGKPYSRQVEGGQVAGAWVEAPTTEDIEYLEGRIDSIEGNISGGGGFVEAPDDGEVYARDGQAPAWVKTYDAEYIDSLEADYKNADAALQGQIDALPDQDFSWDSITDKPIEFPPEAHTQGWDTITGKPADYPPSAHGHEIADVDGLQDALDAAGGTPAWDDVTGKPTEFPPAAHNQGWDTITDKPTEFPPEAHNQGWDTITDKPADYPPSAHDHAWDSITGKPTEFPPADHNHDNDYAAINHTHVVADITDFDPADYQPVGDYLTDADSDGKQYARQDGAWAEVVAGSSGGSAIIISDTAPENPTEGDLWFCSLVGSEGLFCFSDDPNGGDGYWFEISTSNGSGASSWNDLTDKPTEYPPEAHTQDWSTITNTPADYPPSAHGHAWDEITGTPSEFPPAAHNHDGVYQPVGDYITEAPDDGKQYVRESEDWSELVIPDGGTGMVISATEPVDRVEGTQWLNSDTAEVFIFDGAVWLEFPAGSSVSGDGSSQWDDVTDGIAYTAGSVGIGTDTPKGGNSKIDIRNQGNGAGANIHFQNDHNSGFNLGLSGDAEGDVILWNEPATKIKFATNNIERMRIDATGDATFSGSVSADAMSFAGFCGLRTASGTDIVPTDGTGAADVSGNHDLGSSVYKFKNGYFANQVITRSGVSIGTRDLIETLSTLRNATKDETTLEDLRDSIGNAIGGLIEKFEEMQTASTQEINDE